MSCTSRSWNAAWTAWKPALHQCGEQLPLPVHSLQHSFEKRVVTLQVQSHSRQWDGRRIFLTQNQKDKHIHSHLGQCRSVNIAKNKRCQAPAVGRKFRPAVIEETAAPKKATRAALASANANSSPSANFNRRTKRTLQFVYVTQITRGLFTIRDIQ